MASNIFQCGRPVAVDKCRQCGLTIGGQGYVLDPGNRMLAEYVCSVILFLMSLLVITSVFDSGFSVDGPTKKITVERVGPASGV